MTIGSDLSFFSLIWDASLPVQAVMLILVIASMASWKIIYLKIKTLKMAEQNTDDFEKIFWSGGSLSNLYESVSIKPPKDILGLPVICSTHCPPDTFNTFFIKSTCIFI